MKLKSKREAGLAALCARFASVAIAAAFLTGCETAREHSLTYKLWDSAQRPSNRPAPDTKFALFVSRTNNELLVAYDALSERREEVERRAYFVFESDPLVELGRAPRFVSDSFASNMVAVPVCEKELLVTNGLAARFPVLMDRGPGFEMYRSGQMERAYQLPVYDEGMSRSSQIALTPLAVTGDTLMAAGVVATAGAVLWIMVGCPPFANRH